MKPFLIRSLFNRCLNSSVGLSSEVVPQTNELHTLTKLNRNKREVCS